MKWRSIILFVSVCSFSAYYIYEPLPEQMEQKWKIMLTNSFFRTLSHVADFSELVGLQHYMGVMYLITLIEKVVPLSDAHVQVIEESFEGVDVLVYQPQQKADSSDLRRAVVYLHGGGWCLGSPRMSPYDLLARKIVKELNAVVLSVDYRLAPPHHFPEPYEDVYRVVKRFLQKEVLAQYSVHPGRVAVSGDSAGGNLAAAVTQQLLNDPEQQVNFKAQGLLYPVMQALDLNTPSYQQNQDMPLLPRTLMVRFWSEYFTSDKKLFSAMMANLHNSPESSTLLKFVNWSAFLPERYHKQYNYSAPVVMQEKSKALDRQWRWIGDPRASPLLVPDSALHALPKTYVLTCEFDVLRDDGVMYVTRLRAAGVDVTHHHYETGFHGAMMFTVWPTDFLIAHLMTDNFVKWLQVSL
ncbi:arylacetamide deacetylase [Periophthalmus magnuspinnatus]|uniref:arylacetamide deacetylase n=1 Tax=Periophthalmus magnuspinnatus TaxID=409849 RepID=UPI00145C04F6|nr:arylacetamide deacetylase [Periophthalmus magnuspinnatus]